MTQLHDAAALFLGLCAICTSAAAQEARPALPVWEAGPALAVLSYPDYRGSDHYNLSALPVPFVVYRGERVRLSREGLKAELLDNGRLELSLSAGFALPGNSGEADSPRAGMPKLLTTFEVGPSLDWWLSARDTADWTWRLRVPVRAVVASDFRRLEQGGWVASPHLRLDRSFQAGGWRLHVAASAGTVWATRKYHAYYYEVKPEFVTAQRPAYEAEGGYSGARLSASLGASRGRWRLGIGILDDALAGAAFEDSPLVRSEHAAVLGLGLSYRLWQSREVVLEDHAEH